MQKKVFFDIMIVNPPGSSRQSSGCNRCSSCSSTQSSNKCSKPETIRKLEQRTCGRERKGTYTAADKAADAADVADVATPKAAAVLKKQQHND